MKAVLSGNGLTKTMAPRPESGCTEITFSEAPLNDKIFYNFLAESVRKNAREDDLYVTPKQVRKVLEVMERAMKNQV